MSTSSDTTPYRCRPPSPPRPAHRLEAKPTTTTRRIEAITHGPHMCTGPPTSTGRSPSLPPRGFRPEYAPSAPVAMNRLSQCAAAPDPAAPWALHIQRRTRNTYMLRANVGIAHIQQTWRHVRSGAVPLLNTPQGGCSGAPIAQTRQTVVSLPSENGTYIPLCSHAASHSNFPQPRPSQYHNTAQP